MAEEPTTTAAPVDAPAPETPNTTERIEKSEANDETPAAKENGHAATEHAQVERDAVDGENAQGADSAPPDASPDSTPASGGKDKKRKSTGGVPEHKAKKLNKKKSMLSLRLDCRPGDFYWARLKGYPPWPAVICDEEMLPESLLATRPVSTARPDGSIRDDFKEGGKNAKERTFPVMFLYTNEFQWMVNTALTPLDPEECTKIPSTKMTKALQGAYTIASESHDIAYFKTLLNTWAEEEEAFRKAEEEAYVESERLAAEKAAKDAAEEKTEAENEKKPKKKAPRKSKAADEDAEMDDAEPPKSSKKRKKEAESDADTPKPKKTPKVMKLNAPKEPNGEASTPKKSASKPKKKVVTAPKVESEEDKPVLTAEEKLAQREKAALYLRHRLQKGFLSRDQAPQESEMAGMAEFFGQLDSYADLEASIIRSTKIHKVLKAIVKLASVPKDDEYNFKKRSSAMLEIWNKRMEADGDVAPQSAVEKESGPAVEKSAATNGAKQPSSETPGQPKNVPSVEETKEGAEQETEKQTEEKTEDHAEKLDEKPVDGATEEAKEKVASEPPAPVEKAAEPSSDAKTDADGDVSMHTAPETTTA